MNAQKFTKKALEALGSAQSIAIENQNMQVMPEHLLYALVDQDGGLIPSLLSKCGVDTDKLLAMLDSAISKMRQDLHLSRHGQDTLGRGEARLLPGG